MSPLAPQVKAALDKKATTENGVEAQPKIIDPPPTVLETAPLAPGRNGGKLFVYNVKALKALRYINNEPINITNPFLAALAKPSGSRNVTPNVPPNARPNGFSSAFSFNIMSATLNQMQNDRRIHRQAQRYHNGGHHGFNGDRHRQMNRGHGSGSQSSVQIRMSIKTDIKLKEAENAWKPTFLQKSDKDDAAELYKQVRSILNKLTDQNFGVLSEQFQSLNIDTKEKLVEVINLVFNKAVNEPNFSEAYGKLSQYLSQCSQKIDSSSDERAYFKRTLITKCQIEFEQHVANKNTTEAALAPLNEKMDAYKKEGNLAGVNEVKAQIAEEESILRRRLVSTVRFIGELYKLDMLTTNIMNVCINALVREAAQSSNQSSTDQANEKLECLCKLLTTVGGKLEPHNIKVPILDLTNYFVQLKRIADNKIKNFKTSTRIKFMIMDVIELRNNKWKPKITNASLQQQKTML